MVFIKSGDEITKTPKGQVQIYAKTKQSIGYVVFRKAIDLFFSLLGMLFLLLISPILWLLIQCTSSGSMFYWQERVGLNGKVFKMVKLRTMRVDAEKNGPQWTQPEDARITWFGKFLRETHLDELPQCYNILIGQMSLIGPRPERPVFTQILAKELPDYHQRHHIKPGITGWAQINQMYSASVQESGDKLKYDLAYLKNRNYWVDIKILVRTILLVIGFKGR